MYIGGVDITLTDLTGAKERLYRRPIAVGDRRHILDGVVIGIFAQCVGNARIFDVLRPRVRIGGERRAGPLPVNALNLRSIVAVTAHKPGEGRYYLIHQLNAAHFRLAVVLLRDRREGHRELFFIDRPLADDSAARGDRRAAVIDKLIIAGVRTARCLNRIGNVFLYDGAVSVHRHMLIRDAVFRVLRRAGIRRPVGKQAGHRHQTVPRQGRARAVHDIRIAVVCFCRVMIRQRHRHGPRRDHAGAIRAVFEIAARQRRISDHIIRVRVRMRRRGAVVFRPEGDLLRRLILAVFRGVCARVIAGGEVFHHRVVPGSKTHANRPQIRIHGHRVAMLVRPSHRRVVIVNLRDRDVLSVGALLPVPDNIVRRHRRLRDGAVAPTCRCGVARSGVH